MAFASPAPALAGPRPWALGARYESLAQPGTLARRPAASEGHKRARGFAASGARRELRVVWVCELEEDAPTAAPAQRVAEPSTDRRTRAARGKDAGEWKEIRKAEQLMRDLDAVRGMRRARPARPADAPSPPPQTPPPEFRSAKEMEDAPRRVGPDEDAAFAAALPIVESAILASASCVLYIIAKLIPSPSDLAVMAAAAAPPALAMIRHGPKNYMTTMLTGSLVCLMFAGPSIAVKFVLTAGPLSLVYGVGMRRGLPFVALWPAATAMKTAGLLCQLQFVSLLLGFDVLELISHALAGALDRIATEQGSPELVTPALVQSLFLASFASNAGAQAAMLWLGLRTALRSMGPAHNPYAQRDHPAEG